MSCLLSFRLGIDVHITIQTRDYIMSKTYMSVFVFKDISDFRMSIGL